MSHTYKLIEKIEIECTSFHCDYCRFINKGCAFCKNNEAECLLFEQDLIYDEEKKMFYRLTACLESGE